MASKTLKKYQKDISHDQKKKNTYDPSQEKIRVIQQNLVFVSGLPLDLADEEMLGTELYFGRYGKIVKVIINNAQNSKKAQSCQAYVTYQDQLEASTAIIALDGLTMQSRPLKASFGTTKYCTHFLKNYQCLNSQCFYLHHFDKDNQVHSKSDQRTSFIDKNDQALNVVCNNLQKVAQKIVEQGSDENQTDEGFPTLMEMMDFLIDSKLVNSNLVSNLIKKYKSMLNVPKQDSTQQSKKSKSNSFSTIASPSKQQKDQNQQISQPGKIIEIIQQKQEPQKVEKKQQKLMKVQKIQKKQKLEKTKIDSKIEKKIDSKIDNLNQNVRKEEVQKIVQKLIIKQVLNKKSGPHRSRMPFVAQKQASNDSQLQKMKCIIEKHLVASN